MVAVVVRLDGSWCCVIPYFLGWDCFEAHFVSQAFFTARCISHCGFIFKLGEWIKGCFE